ncbi:hypothetical protein RB195_016486 [Necator americanus]|uniref:Uncharacterized protein n=1 Tax=Necator americanus TaxID=51031 RepID=A0ABR1C0R7_NECAM
MEIVKTLINPQNSSIFDEDRQIPESRIWIREIDTFYAAFLVLASLFTIVIIFLTVVQLYYVIKYVSNARIQSDLYYLALMFPVTTICNVAGMFIPRAAIFLYAVALVYFMFCLFVVVSLLFNIFGSRKEMSEYLLERNIRISFLVPPLCCCRFLPDVPSTEQNLQRVEWLVFQTPILRTAFELTSVVVFMELGHRHNLWFMFSQLFGLVSMCVAFYGCYMMVPLGKEKVAPYRFMQLFTIVDIAQCLYTIQKFSFDFAAVFGIISPDRLLTAAAKAQFWSSFMLTWEMMTLSAIASYLLRPSQSIFFDKYPIVDSTSSHTGSNQTINSFISPPARVEPKPKSIFDSIDDDTIQTNSGSKPDAAYLRSKAACRETDAVEFSVAEYGAQNLDHNGSHFTSFGHGNRRYLGSVSRAECCMEIVKTLIISYNTTIDDYPKLPESRIWMQEIDSLYSALLALASMFTIFTILLAISQLYHVVKYVSDPRIQADLYYLVLMFPIAAICNASGMFIPRAALFLYAVGLVYLSLCLFAAASLLFDIFGGRKQMSEYLLKRNIWISFRILPLCCLTFIPAVKSTERNLRRVEWLVFQTPILRTIFEVNSVAVFMELGHRHNLWFMFSQLFGLISLCVAFYGCYVMVPLAKKKIAPYRFNDLFYIVDIAQCCYTIQKFCFDFGATFGMFSPNHLFTPPAKAQFWASFMITFEMMMLSAVATYVMQPAKSAFFDKYPTLITEGHGSSVTFVSTANCIEQEIKTISELSGGSSAKTEDSEAS